MIAQQATSQVRQATQTFDYIVRVWAVADHIPKAPDLVHGSRVFQHGIESSQVGMDVRDDEGAHYFSKRVATRSMIASATSSFPIRGRFSWWPSAYSSVIRLVSTANPASDAEISL